MFKFNKSSDAGFAIEAKLRCTFEFEEGSSKVVKEGRRSDTQKKS